MIVEDMSELLLGGYLPLRAQGLALPCYASGPLSNAWYCAICSVDGDHAGTVIGFEPFEADDIVRLPPAAARTVSIGDPWHDVLLWKGEQHVGTPAIIVAQLGEGVAELAAEAPLTLLDLAMASEELDRGALAATAFAYVQAQWGEAEAVRWQSDGFTRQQLMLEGRRLLKAAGVVDTGIIRGIEVDRNGDRLEAHIPAALHQLFKDHDIFAPFRERAEALARETRIPLAPITNWRHEQQAREELIAREELKVRADRSVSRSDTASAANVLVLASGSRARLLLRYVKLPNWKPRWHDEQSPRHRRRSAEQLGTEHPRVDVIDDRDGLPNLDQYDVVIWLVDDEAFLNDHGRVTGAQLQAALSQRTAPLCIIAPMLPAQRPAAILADRSLASDVPLLDTILDTAVVRSPFWSGNPRRSIDRRVADLVSATAQLAAPGSPLHGWLTEDRQRPEPLLLSIALGVRLGRERSALSSEVSSAGLILETNRYHDSEEFTWSERPSGGERTKVLEGMAMVRRHDPAFQTFAEAMARHQAPKVFELGEVPSSISDNLHFPHLAAAFRAGQNRSDAICVVTAEAPSLKALRTAAKIGWSVIRFSDEETLRFLTSGRGRKQPLLPADVAMPDLNRLGRNRGLAIRGVDPRDVIRIPAHVLERWQDRHGGSDLAASSRWYRSSINRYDEAPETARAAAIPAELFVEAERLEDEAARFLREHDEVAIVAAGAPAKRVADLHASWWEPAEGTSRFMFEDGKLPVRFRPLDRQEVAAQKFFTIDGDASVPLLFSSRLFHVWARATLTRSPSWLSRFSITRTFETFPLPDQFMVLSDGEGGRASLRASPRSNALSHLLEDFDPDMLRSGRGLSAEGWSAYGAYDRSDFLEEVEARLLNMIGLPPDATDLDILERLVEMNRSAGS